MKIFDFEFLSVFNKDKNEEIEDEEISYKYRENEVTFKKPQELFKKYLSKYDYFNLEILYEYFLRNDGAVFYERFIYKYFFAKTKGNKYIFKTEYINYVSDNYDINEVFNKEIRNCNNINYNNYYFINNESGTSGNEDSILLRLLDFDIINSYSYFTKYYYSYKFSG